MFKKHKFNSRGIGIVTTTEIVSDMYVGDYFTKFEPITFQSRLIYDGWVETNPLGRYLNHNKLSNCRLLLDGDVIRIFTNTKIQQFEELTINYFEVADLIKLPKTLIDKYSIIDYEYIEEPIINKSNLL